MNTKKKQPSYSGEFRDRAVRLVEEQQKVGLSQWAAIQSISQKLGCTPETLRRWVRRVERDQGKRAGLPSAEAEELKQLRRENKELKRANEILRTASAYFAQAELDRRQR
jgi:transposase